MAEPTDALQCRGISVSFGEVAALRDVSVAFAPARIHAVVGQNGAGKTTFARVCAGIVRPDAGELRIAGRAVATGQVESQQAVEIARALVTDARVLILDEPTAVLSSAGIATLFARVAGLRQSGVTVILILHKIREVLATADTVTVLRGGRLVAGPIATRDIDARHLAAAIIGAAPAEASDLSDQAALVGAPDAAAARAATGARAAAAAVLEMRSVATRADAEGRPLDGLDLAVRAGEIVGVAGVEGNGQRTLVRAFAGLATVQAGTITLGGADVTQAAPLARRAAGLRIIPFERNSEGLSLTSSLWENWGVRLLLARSVLALIDPRRQRVLCESSLRQWDVRFAATTQPAGALSSGNAQKLILAREVDASAAVVVAAQPTRGLDIGATAFVWRALRGIRARGCGVLLISSDLDELFDISDRIVVMFSGRVAGTFTPPYRLEAIGRAMTGADR